jgi:RHS repeat-associated protein
LKFTGQVRDSETGNDFFNARYYTAGYGRFLSPDPGNAGADLSNPQSWNAYAYVGNNPLGFTDPNGACAVFIAGITQGYNSGSAFTQIAGGFGAVQAYPYANLSSTASIDDVSQQGDNVLTPGAQTALSAIQSALNNNAGPIDLVGYSGGAAALTTAYYSLSPDQQQRIDSITYISPGSNGALAGNNQPQQPADTTVVRGSALDGADQAAMVGTSFPFNAPVTATGCKHTDFACLWKAAANQAAKIRQNGKCLPSPPFSRPAAAPKAPANSAGTTTYPTQYSGLGYDEFDLLQFINHGPGVPVVKSTITYP